MRRSADRGHVGRGDRRVVEDETNGRAVEVSAGHDVALRRKDQRVVRGAVHLALEDGPAVLEGVARRAMNLGHAPQRVVVLNPSAAPVRLADRAAREQPAQIRRGIERSRMRPGADDPRIEGDIGAAGGVDRRCARQVGDPREKESAVEGEAAHGNGHLDPVDESQALLCAERDRADARPPEGSGGPQRPALEPRLALADQEESQVSERREVSGGAHGALLGHDREAIGREHPQKRFDRPDANARPALGEGIGPQDHHGPHGLVREGAADSGGVAAHEIPLERLDVRLLNRHVGKPAESGIDAVDALAALEGFVDRTPRRRNRPPRRRRKRRPRAAPCHVDEIVEAQPRAVQEEPLHRRAIV